MNKKIFVTKKIIDTGLKALSEKGYQVVVWDKTRAPSKTEIIREAKDAVAIISMLADPIDAEVLKSCKNLKVVANYAVGHNNIDSATATKLGICVGNTPNVLTEATADLALTLLMAVARNIVPASQYVKNGEWMRWEPMTFLGTRLSGKTIGIVGMGRIGQAMARRCGLGLNMNVIYTAQSAKPDADKTLHARQVDFETLLKESDVISLHAPLTPKTRGLFNAETFGKMKHGALFINTARGEMHDEQALYNALITKQLAGAGLDVTTPEPTSPNSPLLFLDNVVVTPHIGSADRESREEMSMLCAENILAALEKRALPGFVNPEVIFN